jgi:hypothetical protein
LSSFAAAAALARPALATAHPAVITSAARTTRAAALGPALALSAASASTTAAALAGVMEDAVHLLFHVMSRREDLLELRQERAHASDLRF